MDNYSVSGCIVTYNNKRTINDTLKTIFEFTKDIDFKLYVVDNGSTDGTVELIKENYPQINLIQTGENIGFGKGHNHIIDELDSKYHFIINPDIILCDNVIRKIAEYFENNSDAGIVSPKICFPDGRLQILGKRNPKLKYLVASRLRNDEQPGKVLSEYAMLETGLDKEMDIEVASGCFFGIRTDLFRQIGGFDDRYFMYFEDFDLSRFINKISKVRYYPEAVIYHEWGRDSKRNTKLKIIHISSMFKYFLKWAFKK